MATYSRHPRLATICTIVAAHRVPTEGLRLTSNLRMFPFDSRQLAYVERTFFELDNKTPVVLLVDLLAYPPQFVRALGFAHLVGIVQADEIESVPDAECFGLDWYDGAHSSTFRFDDCFLMITLTS